MQVLVAYFNELGIVPCDGSGNNHVLPQDLKGIATEPYVKSICEMISLIKWSSAQTISFSENPEFTTVYSCYPRSVGLAPHFRNGFRHEVDQPLHRAPWGK